MQWKNIEKEPESIVAETVLEALDLVEIFYNLFATGDLGEDREKAKAKFLFDRGLNKNPDVLDEDV